MIEISNLSGISADIPSLKKLAKNILKEENRERVKLNVVLVEKEEIKKLNRKYRGKDEETDVLSFPAGKEFIAPFEDLGEVVICPEKVREYAQVFEKEMRRVLIHGILHLLGHDHEKSEKETKVMEEKTKQYL